MATQQDIKEVLVCLGERKRAVTFPASSKPSLELDNLRVAVKVAYDDILGEDDEVVIQTKSERWNGEFVEVRESVENNSVLTICVDNLKRVKEKTRTSTAVEYCRKVGSVSEKSAKALKSLFPSCSSQSFSLSGKRKFDPSEECVVASQKRKKKSTNVRSKPRLFYVVLLPKETTFVPKGYNRTRLSKKGRIFQVLFRRNMSAQEVNSTIVDSFSAFNLQEFRYLKCGQDNRLKVVEDVDLNGDEIIDMVGQGSLYIIKTMASRSKPRKPSILRSFIKSKFKRGPVSLAVKRARHPIVFDLSLDRVYSPCSSASARETHRETHSTLDDEDLDSFEPDYSSDDERPLKKPKKRPYSDQLKKQDKVWDSISSSLCKKYMSKQVLATNQICSYCSKRALYRCNDCNPGIFYCKECCIQQHSNRCVFHVPEEWTNGQFIPVMLCDNVFPLDHSCSTERKERIVIVSIKGYHHGIICSFCKCTSMIERMVNLNLWPASPTSPRFAFTMDLLDIIHAGMIECQVSINHMCNMLWFLAKLKEGKEHKRTYQQLLRSFPRYRSFKSLISANCEKLCGSEYMVECPACSKDVEGTSFVALDGNFRLCRRKQAGIKSTYRSPLNKFQIFANQSDVDQYVNKSPSSLAPAPEPNKCHEFKAGDALRSKTRYHCLDETGVLGATCRHHIPLKMISMKHGERLSYADFILSKLVEEGKIPRKINLLYDIGCKLVCHWKANQSRLGHLLSTFNVAVAVFHAYAHNAHCQYHYSPRRRSGFGLTDGENLERLWSYLGKFSHMTKEMNAANRIDTLSDALYYYADQKIAKMENSITLLFKKANDTKVELEKEMNAICQTVGITTEQLQEKLPELQEEEAKRIDSVAQIPTNHIEAWKLSYVQHLQSWSTLQEKWANLLQTGVLVKPIMIVETVNKLLRLDSELRTIEMRHHIDPRWNQTSAEYQQVLSALTKSDKQIMKERLLGFVKERTFYLNTLRHHAGGQKQSQRISRLIASCTSKAKNLLEDYKELCTSSSDPTQSIRLCDVFDLNSAFWISDHTYALQTIHFLPVAKQRRLIEVNDTILRCIEELQYCISDILHLLSYFEKRLTCVNSALLEIVSLDLSQYTNPMVVYQTIGDLFDTLRLILPPQQVEAVSSGISHAEYTFYRIQRISDVASNLVTAYWATSQCEREAHIKQALLCSQIPISVPAIAKLPCSSSDNIDCDMDSSNDEHMSVTSDSSIDEASDLSSMSSETSVDVEHTDDDFD